MTLSCTDDGCKTRRVSEGLPRRPLTDMESLRAEAKDRQGEALLDAAERLLAESGPEAVSMRRVAELVGASSQVVITRFTNKQGLADALLQRGYDRLRTALDAVAVTADAREDVAECLRAYRAFALANPPLYRVMFGQAVAREPLSDASATAAHHAFEALADVVRRARDQGQLSVEDPDAASEVLWAAAHGVVSLEITGFLSRPRRGEATFEALLEGLLGPVAGQRSRRRPAPR